MERKPKMHFTDREKESDIFENVLNAVLRDVPNMLVFYGIAGQGKSRLSKKILDDFSTKKDSHVLIGHYTFDGQVRERYQSLLQLRMSLTKNSKINFTGFDFALVLLLSLTNPHLQLRDFTSSISRKEGILGQALVSIHNECEETIGKIPGIGMIVRAAFFAKRMFDNWMAKLNRPSLYELRDSSGKLVSEAEILQILPRLFGEDITFYLKDNPDEKIAILIDEYEQIWSRRDFRPGEIDVDDDLMLQALVSHSPGALWVFFSRYRLHWENEKKWEKFLENRQYGLEGLPPADAANLLKSEPIKEEPIREVMLRTASDQEGFGVHPFLLELQIMHYYSIKNYENRNPEPVDFEISTPGFSERRKQLIRRFKRDYIRISHLLDYLAVARKFNRAIFELMLTKFPCAAGIMVFDQEIIQLPFVQNFEEGQYKFAHIWREAITEEMSSEATKQIHECLFEYYDSKSQITVTQKITCENIEGLQEAAYHLSKVDISRFNDWLGEKISIYHPAGCFSALSNILKLAVHINDDGNKKNAAFLLARNRLARSSYDQGFLQESQKLFCELVDYINDSEQSDVNTSYLVNAHNWLVYIYVEKGELKKAAAELEKVDQIIEADKKDKKNLCGHETVFFYRAIAKLETAAQNLVKAEQFLRRAYNLASLIAPRDFDSQFIVKHDLGNALLEIGRFSEAEACFLECVSYYQKVFGPNHRSTLISMFSLARAMYEQNKNMGALVLLEVINHQIEQYPETLSDPRMARVKYEYAKVLRDIGDIKQAERLILASLDVEQAVFGNNLRVGSMMCHLGICQNLLGRPDEAERTFRMSLSILQNLSVFPEAMDARIKNRFAELMIDVGNTTEAEHLLDDALETLTHKYGPDHFRVARCWINHSKFLKKQGKVREADKSLRQAKEILGLSIYSIRLPGWSWESVSLVEGEKILEKIYPRPITKEHLSLTEIKSSKLDHIYLVDCSLLSFSFENTPVPSQMFAVKYANEVILLNGMGESIGLLNDALDLKLTEDRVLPYVRLFCEVLSTCGNKFIICENPEEIEWRLEASESLISKIKEKIFSPTVQIKSGPVHGGFIVDCCMLFTNYLSKVSLSVTPDGGVSMSDDTKLAEDLPVPNYMRGPSPDNSHSKSNANEK